MRVLIFNWKDLAHPAAGGAEVYVEEIARRWVASGHRVTLFCSAVAGRPATEVIGGVTVVRQGGRLGVYRAAREYYRRQGRGRFDVVIDAVNTKPFGCATWVRDVPVIAIIHQLCREVWFREMPLPVALLGRFVLEPMWLRTYRDSPVLTVSESSRSSLAEVGLRDVRLIPEGVTWRQRPAVPRETRPTMVFLGRLAANKRPRAALDAFCLLRDRVPDAQLWFIGDGPQHAELARDAPAGVRLFGKVDREHRDELLARAHVLVMTSVREGWGLVVDEAAAMGTPTIGYDRPGLSDSIPAAGGVLVQPHPAALADGLAAGLPRWTQSPATTGWRGGAKDWDSVATIVLDRISSLLGAHYAQHSQR
ncbi:MAG: glycosyltransferase family 4 protein [Dactylosporangium sp.]|nr:glycosyltransferase family 4 protein [Dactylosporangium sp.]NNJ62608.1 glycosyltransferase family 4 protein [Dactylosporangium sp.]